MWFIKKKTIRNLLYICNMVKEKPYIKDEFKEK